MSTKVDKKVEFTDRDREIMAVAWTCFDGEPKVDYQKLADKLGMTNKGSASNAWAKIKEKIKALSGEGGSVTPAAEGTPKKTPGKSSPKKRGKAQAENGNDEDDESPAKKSKGGKGKGGKKAAARSQDDEDDATVKAEAAEEDGDEF